MKIIVLLLASMVGFILSSQPAPRELSSASAVARQDDENPLLVFFSLGKLYKLDITTGEETLIFEQRYTAQQFLTVAPNNTLVAFSEIKPGIYHTAEARHQGRYDVWAEAYIRVISPDGRLLHTLEDGIKYTWSPDGNKIAYVTFDLNDADYTYRSPTGLWIYDLATGERKKIAAYARSLKWAEFDHNLYFTQRSAVLRYNPDSGVIDATAYLGMGFSPDGEYLFRRTNDGDYQFRLYETGSNRDISERLPTKLGPPIKWISGQGHFLLFTKAEVITKTRGPGLVKVVISRKVIKARHFLFDVETGRVIKGFDGLPSKWVGNGQAIAVERGGKVVLEGLPDKQ